MLFYRAMLVLTVEDIQRKAGTPFTKNSSIEVEKLFTALPELFSKKAFAPIFKSIEKVAGGDLMVESGPGENNKKNAGNFMEMRFDDFNEAMTRTQGKSFPEGGIRSSLENHFMDEGIREMTGQPKKVQVGVAQRGVPPPADFGVQEELGIPTNAGEPFAPQHLVQPHDPYLGADGLPEDYEEGYGMLSPEDQVFDPQYNMQNAYGHQMQGHMVGQHPQGYGHPGHQQYYYAHPMGHPVMMHHTYAHQVPHHPQMPVVNPKPNKKGETAPQQTANDKELSDQNEENEPMESPNYLKNPGIIEEIDMGYGYPMPDRSPMYHAQQLHYPYDYMDEMGHPVMMAPYPPQYGHPKGMDPRFQGYPPHGYVDPYMQQHMHPQMYDMYYPQQHYDVYMHPHQMPPEEEFEQPQKKPSKNSKQKDSKNTPNINSKSNVPGIGTLPIEQFQSKGGTSGQNTGRGKNDGQKKSQNQAQQQSGQGGNNSQNQNAKVKEQNNQKKPSNGPQGSQPNIPQQSQGGQKNRPQTSTQQGQQRVEDGQQPNKQKNPQQPKQQPSQQETYAQQTPNLNPNMGGQQQQNKKPKNQQPQQDQMMQSPQQQQGQDKQRRPLQKDQPQGQNQGQMMGQRPTTVNQNPNMQPRQPLNPPAQMNQMMGQMPQQTPLQQYPGNAMGGYPQGSPVQPSASSSSPQLQPDKNKKPKPINKQQVKNADAEFELEEGFYDERRNGDPKSASGKRQVFFVKK